MAESITDLVKDAVKVLEPYFELKDMKPRIAVDQSPQGISESFSYDPESRIIFVTEDKTMDRNMREFSVGEEAGHFLHHEANPSVFEYKAKIIEAAKKDIKFKEAYYLLTNFIELVGNLAAIVYHEKRQGVQAAREAARKLSNVTGTAIEGTVSGKKDIGPEAAKHAMGYFLAARAYLEAGDVYLASAAMYTFEDIMQPKMLHRVTKEELLKL